MAGNEANEPMGGEQFEERNPQGYDLETRNVWAIDVLIEEVLAAFDTEVETHTLNRFAANMVVVFSPATREWDDLSTLLSIVGGDDERVESVEIDEKAGTITIMMVRDPILYDTRDSYRIADAALGLDRELGPDDMTSLVADLSKGDEGFTEGTL